MEKIAVQMLVIACFCRKFEFYGEVWDPKDANTEDSNPEDLTGTDMVKYDLDEQTRASYRANVSKRFEFFLVTTAQHKKKGSSTYTPTDVRPVNYNYTSRRWKEKKRRRGKKSKVEIMEEERIAEKRQREEEKEAKQKTEESEVKKSKTVKKKYCLVTRFFCLIL